MVSVGMTLKIKRVALKTPVQGGVGFHISGNGSNFIVEMIRPVETDVHRVCTSLACLIGSGVSL